MLMLFGGVALVAACDRQQPASEQEPAGNCAEAEAVVRTLGERMRNVSLLAPDSLLAPAMEDAYGDVVHAELLADWKAAPARAPGRETSNPWPQRVEPHAVEQDGDACIFGAHVVYVTTPDTATIVEERPVRIALRKGDGWRITGFVWLEQSPVDVLQRYYDAVNAGDYATAYSLWADSGRASGKTLAEFTAGYAQTARTELSIAGEVRIEGAAGTHYATVPVVINAELRDGTRQRFAGTYTLRRSLVDGATPEQRSWRIRSAEIR